MTFHFHTDQTDEANALVLRYHHSRRVPANVQLVVTLHESGGLFGDFGSAVAACFFSIPPTRWSEDVWELSRLVRRNDVTITLTPLIAWAVQWIRTHRLADLLVSFADRTVGHHGGIYQAASWNYGGLRKPQNDGVVIEGKFMPGRSANSTFGTRSVARLAEMGIAASEHWDAGKHLYWRAPLRSGRKKATRLGLSAMPYPRPAVEVSRETRNASSIEGVGRFHPTALELEGIPPAPLAMTREAT